MGALCVCMHYRSVLSDSAALYGPQSARLLHPRDSPGKNSGVGLPFPSPGELPDPGIKPGSLALQADASTD